MFINRWLKHVLVAEGTLLAPLELDPCLQAWRVKYVPAYVYFKDLRFRVKLIHADWTKFLTELVQFVCVCVLRCLLSARWLILHVPVVFLSCLVSLLLSSPSLVSVLLVVLLSFLLNNLLAAELYPVSTAASKANPTSDHTDY